jgi:RNA polymerase sigma-70 factor (family 1)
MTDPTGMSRKKESDGHSSDGPVFVRPTPGSEGEKLRENESELIIRNALESDTAKGIELLFRWYYVPLCSHAVRYVSSREIAEDIVSDVFYQFHSEETFRKVETSFRAYLFTSVRYRAFDYVRAEMRRSTSLQQAEYMPIGEDQQPDNLTQFEDLYHDVLRAIHDLPVKRREIYMKHRFEGKKYQEIAKEMDLSLRTVETHMYQAIHQVRKFLSNRWLALLLSFLLI